MDTRIVTAEAALLLELEDAWAALEDRGKARAMIRFDESRRGWVWTNRVRPSANGNSWLNRTVQPLARSAMGKRVLMLLGAGAYSIAAAVTVVTVLSAMIIGAAYSLHGVPPAVTRLREIVEFSGLLSVVGAYFGMGYLCVDLVCRYDAAQRLIDRGRA